jgi:hypothetical protein
MTCCILLPSRVLTCLTYTTRRRSQHRGQAAGQEDTKVLQVLGSRGVRCMLQLLQCLRWQIQCCCI